MTVSSPERNGGLNMYNIRRLLTIAAVILFIISIASSVFGGRTHSQPSDGGAASPGGEAADTAFSIPEGGEHFVAHRGYSAAAPENTALAFELAGKAAFWGIETDICETYDNEFVCMHDDTIDRTTDGEGEVGDYTYMTLRTMSVDAGANIDRYGQLKIPSMVEYLNICVTYNCVPIIEIKKIKDYDKFLQTIYNSNLQSRCIVIGQIEDLREIRARDEDIALMVVGYSNIEYTRYIELISEISGIRGILYNYPSVTEDVVNEVHSYGLLCGVWSLDTAEEAQQFMSYGVDFVVTNEIPGATNLMINQNE